MKVWPALPGLLLAAVLAGCGGQAGAGSVSAPAAPAVVPTPEPVPVVEPTCIAEYPRYDSIAEVVERSDAIVRGRATASRDYDLYPDPPSGTDPATSPQHGVPQEEIDAIPGIASTALSLTITEVIKGDLTTGQVIEVNQNTCTSRPLPVGEDTDYVLALTTYDPDRPSTQVNDSQAAWQASGEQTLTPVNPDNDLGVATIEDLIVAVIAQAPPG